MSRERGHSLLPLLLALGGWAVCWAAEAGTFRGSLVVEDFESFAWGSEWATAEFSAGADPRMTPVGDEAHSGRQACRLSVPPGESLTLVTQHGTRFSASGDKPPLPLPGTPETIGLWVRGRNSGHRLWLQLLDAEGKKADVDLGVVDFLGWRLMQAKVPSLTPPVGLRGLLVHGGTGPLVLDDVTVGTAMGSPLYVDARPATPEEVVEGQASRFRVVVQSLASEPRKGKGEVAAFAEGAVDRPVARRRFSFSVSAGAPFAATVSLRLAAGVYDVITRAEAVECRRRVVVYPAERRVAPANAGRAVRRFEERRDALLVYESALSPATVVESSARTLTLFRGLQVSGLSAPQDCLMPVKAKGGDTSQRELEEPWLVVWFGASPQWAQVTFADRSPCTSFDVPFLLAFESRPAKVEVAKEGLRLSFAGRAGRVAVMPLFGIRRLSPSQTSQWKEDLELARSVVDTCRTWARVLAAYPIDVREEVRVDAKGDAVEVRSRFSYLETRSDWDEPPMRVAPVPPLLLLAMQAGFPVRFSEAPRPTGCLTSVGPYAFVSDADATSYTMAGLLQFVNRAVADVPEGGPETQVTLARRGLALSSDAGKIPFWVRQAGERGRLASEVLARYMLSADNARYAFGADGRMRAWDGLAWQEQGDEAATAAVAEQLRGCWYAGFYAGLWDLLRGRWHHIASLRETLASESDWATLGMGAGGPLADARVNAEVFFARTAARLDRGQAYAEACCRAARLLAASYALTAAAPAYAARLAPWPGLAGQAPGETTLSLCRPGSLGFAPGPPPFFTAPSDAGYSFARHALGDYFREHFRSGPFDFYGRSPDEWTRRTFMGIDPPRLEGGFHPAPPPAGPFRGNYVYTVEPGSDGWPAFVWASHRSPAGTPLSFGSIGTGFATRGKLRRTLCVSPWLRLSAYEAIEAPQPPKEKESPKPPAPAKPPAPPAAGRPAQGRP